MKLYFLVVYCKIKIKKKLDIIMNKAVSNVLLALSTLFILGSCSEDEPDGIEHQPNYVAEYLVPKSLRMNIVL